MLLLENILNFRWPDTKVIISKTLYSNRGNFDGQQCFDAYRKKLDEIAKKKSNLIFCISHKKCFKICDRIVIKNKISYYK